MKKFQQTSLTDDGSDTPGDCMRSAWGSVLEVPPCELPKWSSKMPWKTYWRNWKIFFRLKGFEIKRAETVPPKWKADQEYFIAVGPSPRTDLAKHCVVWSREGFEWDPYPKASGLDGDPDFFEWLVRSKPNFDPLPKWEWGEFTNGKRRVPPINIS